MTNTTESSSRDLLRHTIATLAYRAGKALRNAPPEFSSFRVADGSRTPAQILAHMCDLLDWANWLVLGEHIWANSTPAAWDDDVARFYAGLKKLDDFIAGGAQLGRSPELLFQGPIADALTHTGQITMLRRVAGAPIRGESYLRADITVGRVGLDQAAPRYEFD